MRRTRHAFAWNYCPICGDKLSLQLDGSEERPHCARCRRCFYSNPAPAACCIVARGDEVLLVQRAVEPRKGEWSLPGGFVELGETTEEAGLRELKEETGLVGRGLRLLGVSTHASPYSGAVVVLGYVVETWAGTLRPASDVSDVGFFRRADRPPLAFRAHRRLMALFDVVSVGGVEELPHAVRQGG